jgi:hypothetical protein
MQIVAVFAKWQEVEGGVGFVDGEDADGVAAVVSGAQKRGAFDVERRDGGDAGDGTSAREAMDVKALGGDEGILGFAEQNDIAVEVTENLDGTFEERIEEAELHENQDDRECDT